MRGGFYLNSDSVIEKNEGILEGALRKWFESTIRFVNFSPRKLLEKVERSFVEIIYEKAMR